MNRVHRSDLVDLIDLAELVPNALSLLFRSTNQQVTTASTTSNSMAPTNTSFT